MEAHDRYIQGEITMKAIVFIFGLILSVLVIGCESTPTSTSSFYSGDTHADAVLKKDTLNMIALYIMADGCNSIEHVDTSVLHYDPRNGVKDHVWSKEEWIVTGCSKSFPFDITYSEDGGRGTFVKVSEKDSN